MEGRRFATVISEDLSALYEATTCSPQLELTLECAGLKASLLLWSTLNVACMGGAACAFAQACLMHDRCTVSPQQMQR